MDTRDFFRCIARVAILSFGTFGVTGCSTAQPDSFTLLTELPPEFRLRGEASYVPRTGETCTVPPREGRNYPGLKFFEQELNKDAQTANFEIPLTSKTGDCPLVLDSFSFEVQGKYGAKRLDIGRDYAGLSFQDGIANSQSLTSPIVFQNQCQWLFRTIGKKNYITKILKCKTATDESQTISPVVGGSLQRDQLAGKTVKVVFSLMKEERPYMGDTWIKFPEGWKRCMGESIEDPYAFCRGNTTNFKPFKMPDGRDCTVYPNCTE
ncbi:hypothetical protein ABH905_004527 [Pseudomonas frederiksbergensis]|uniref:hypothetical protein n=1 Tax=Pseudomonas frederiksbergensis TaxID=104087 RepID=UPI003D1DBEAD